MSKNQTFYYSTLVKIKNLKRLSTFPLMIKNLHKRNMLNIQVSILIAIYLGKNIKITSCKISEGIGILKKMRKFLQEKQLKNVYNVFIKPSTEYNILVQGGVTKTQRCKYLKIVLFDINLKLQQGDFMKQFSFDLQQKVLQNISL